MNIESIKLQNFKAFRHLELLDIPKLAVFVGANGSGKSTLFEVFAFLSDALKDNVRSALASRGGFGEVRSRSTEGPIVIELQFRLEIVGIERLVTYKLEIDERNGFPVVQREVLRYKRSRYGSPFHFLDFSLGKGVAVFNEDEFGKKDHELDREEQNLDSPDVLAIKGLGQFEKFKAASAFRYFIEHWHVSDFKIGEARISPKVGHEKHLSASGDNLGNVTQYIINDHPDTFEEVVQKMRARIPGVVSVEAKTTEEGTVLLKFKDDSFDTAFVARRVSDGTIKMFAYLILLHDPAPHPLLCIEEPENQLYPKLLGELVEELRFYSQRSHQVFVTSHSPDLINHLSPEEVYWIEKHEGYSNVYHALDDKKIVALYDAGDQLGNLWSQDYFKSADK